MSNFVAFAMHAGTRSEAIGLEMAQRWPRDGPEMARRRLGDGPKMAPKWLGDGLGMVPRRSRDGPKMARRWPGDGLPLSLYLQKGGDCTLFRTLPRAESFSHFCFSAPCARDNVCASGNSEVDFGRQNDDSGAESISWTRSRLRGVDFFTSQASGVNF